MDYPRGRLDEEADFLLAVRWSKLIFDEAGLVSPRG